ncbi:class I SAM-dependent methyltransferase [Natranaerofaba carboxydovora]|uniref:class I SAM-dependent methyltransferase n=1 Tax=Natranaerofaba carboxydovora TaxID=2742683 RepID=UPI001F13A6B0|nr:class I SAM-dependent methyltransferase [Natranaerofaba carboxydovora]UMZ72585.1 Glycine/sarcosine N-methyltransferase [Natranaerofaba carboxydovora]
MDFHDYLAKYYGELFNPSKDKIDLIARYFSNIPGNKVLDIGCGTGEYIEGLLARGFDVYGIDFSYKMVDIARSKVTGDKKDCIKVGDMKQPYPFNLNLYFDGIYSIGNTLVHLDDLDQVNATIGLAYSRLNKDGKLLIQIINYDQPEVLYKKFPVLEAEEGLVKFYRSYEPADNPKDVYKVLFKTKLELTEKERNDKKVLEDTNKLLMLKRGELENILEEVGFRDIKFYGDFDFNTWSKTSNNTIALATK